MLKKQVQNIFHLSGTIRVVSIIHQWHLLFPMYVYCILFPNCNVDYSLYITYIFSFLCGFAHNGPYINLSIPISSLFVEILSHIQGVLKCQLFKDSYHLSLLYVEILCHLCVIPYISNIFVSFPKLHFKFLKGKAYFYSLF